MEGVQKDTGNVPSTAKRRRVSSINFDLCLLCQTQTKETKSVEKLIESIRIRSECNDENYTEIALNLGEKTGEDLITCSVKWHISFVIKSVPTKEC